MRARIVTGEVTVAQVTSGSDPWPPLPGRGPTHTVEADAGPTPIPGLNTQGIRRRPRRSFPLALTLVAGLLGCEGQLTVTGPAVPEDAARSLDASVGVDAGGATPVDAGTLVDASSDADAARPDAGLPDAGPPAADAGPPPTIDADFCETGGQLVMEAEHFRSQTGYAEVPHGDASGGIAMQVGDGGSLDFRIHLETGGTYYFWVRTLADGPESNGIFVALDGTRIEAPPGHRYAGRSDIYLYKSATVWFWEPLWQGTGSGAVAGPVTFTASAGVHTLSIQKRIVERPLIDRIVLTLGPTEPSGFGPPETPCR